MRFVRTLISLGFVLFGVGVLALAVGAYLTATGLSVPVMRTVVGKVGDLTAGQRTQQMTVSLTVEPSSRRLEGVVRLVVKAEEERRRLYLLLNDGLVVRAAWRELPSGERAPVHHYRFWLMSVIDLGGTLAAGEETTVEIAYGGDPFAGLSPFGQRVLEADEVILTATDLWYPTDLKSFFSADVEVTLPQSLTLVHGGTTTEVADLGSSRRVRWTSDSPVPGLGLVAGRYDQLSAENAGVAYRAYFGGGIELDGANVLASMTEAVASMSAAYGVPGTSHHAVFVSRRLRRPFADGSGIIGLPPAVFSHGDYGFAAIADGVARAWWGATVAAPPTSPQSGGAWAIEGFAANAARHALRQRFGADAEFRWRAGRAFDPAAAGALAAASWLDWELEPDGARALRDKAAYVAMMLQDQMGDAAYSAAARAVIDRFRGASVSSQGVREIFSEASGADLGRFFDQWVDSDGRVDLSLDPKQGGAVVANHQAAVVGPEVELWRVPPGGQPVEQKIEVGASTPLGNAERIVVDPRGLLADMVRSNNVLPREDAPRLISRSPRGSWMVVDGEPHDWDPATVRVIDGSGKMLHAWSFELGILGEPRWSSDGTHILVTEPSRGGPTTLYALHPSDGSMVEIGHDAAVFGRADGFVATREGRLVLVGGKQQRELANVGDGRIGDPRISPDGTHVAFAVRRGEAMELRAQGLDSVFDRVLMTWPSGPLRWQWSPDGSRLFAVLSGDWDWQLWEIPVDGLPRPLMREAAGVRALAVSDDGNRVALAAQAEPDYRFERYEVIVIDRGDPAGARRYTVSGRSVVDLSWRDAESLLVVATDPTYAMVPARRDIVQLKLTDGSVLPFPTP